jgi:hypothetical protein
MRQQVIGLLMTLIAAAGAMSKEPGGVPAARNILLNEAADALVSMVPEPKTPEGRIAAEQAVGGLRAKLDQYAATRVSHVFLNVCYQRACFASRAWETYWDVDDPAKQVTGWPRRYWLIYEAGVDPFAICIARCRELGISPWLSIRMNDTHYSDEQNKMSRLWWDHPEYRSGPRAGFDFNVPAVREHCLALVAELVERYDGDGVELDWMRFAQHFKRGEGAKRCPVLTSRDKQDSRNR